MAAIIWADVLGVAPELSTFPVAGQVTILAIANAQLTVTDWGGETDPTLKAARIYLAAHHATIARRRGVGGAITSEGAGGLARGYQSPQSTSMMATTGYGQLFLALARTRPFRAGILPGQWKGGGTGGWGGGC